LPELNFYFAYNAFRLAAICQGIVGRVRDGTANSANADTMEARVAPLAAFAADCARKAGMEG
jgi:aminoglycoside phosphotransferase (APT) family kinase protein